MLKLNVGKGRQVIKLPQSVAILRYSTAAVATERTGKVLYRALASFFVCLLLSKLTMILTHGHARQSRVDKQVRNLILTVL